MNKKFMPFENMPVTKVNEKTESFPKMFGIESKENYISNWLAYILDPSRFLSNEPLIKFLELIKENDEDDLAILINHLSNNSDFDTANLNVQREVTLSSSGRIDLLIEYNVEDAFIAIGIENKIYSPLISGQVNRYKNAFARIYYGNHQKCRVIALTPSWNSSQKNEIDFHYTYNDLAGAFESIAFNKLDYRQYFIIREFIKYIEDFLIEESSMLDYEWAEYNKEHAGELITIYENGKTQLEKLCELITNYLKKEFNVDDEASEWEVTSHHKTYFYIQLYKKEWKKYNLHYEIGKQDDFNTRKFILPPELMLTIDLENEASKQKFRRFREINDSKYKMKYHNGNRNVRDYVILNKEYEMDYSSLNQINKELKKMVEEIKKANNDYMKRLVAYLEDDQK